MCPTPLVFSPGISNKTAKLVGCLDLDLPPVPGRIQGYEFEDTTTLTLVVCSVLTDEGGRALTEQEYGEFPKKEIATTLPS